MQGHQELGGLIKDYQLASLENCRDLLRSFSFQQIFDVLVRCINSRNFGQFSMILGVVEGDWAKVE